MHSKILDYIHHEGPHWAVQVEYSPYSNNQVRLIAQNDINDQAIRRKYYEGITIDGVESLDLDDGIWAEKTKFWYAVFVHISDVTEAIPIYSPLDLEAMTRTTSVYRGEGVINMLPPPLSQHLLSLNENGEKLTLTMRIELDHSGNILNSWVEESKFKNVRRYNYEDFVDDFLEPESEHHQSIHLMYDIAMKLKALRRQEGALEDYDESDRQLSLEPRLEKSHFSRKKIPSTIIEEFMILANRSAAVLASEHEFSSIYRIHNSPTERALYSAASGLHAGLALRHYTHFTSPIRRYADMIVHRVLKALLLRDDNPPYLWAELRDIAHHINLSRTVIDILGREADSNLIGKQILARVRERTQESITTSDLTDNLRSLIGNGKKIPKELVIEITKDITNGDRAHWAWAIGIFLVSWNNEIKQCLKKALLEDQKFQPKAVLTILTNSKILSSDKHTLFQIEQTEIYPHGVAKPLPDAINPEELDNEESQGIGFIITVYFRQERALSYSINYGKYSRAEAIGIARQKILEGIIHHFCGKD